MIEEHEEKIQLNPGQLIEDEDEQELLDSLNKDIDRKLAEVIKEIKEGRNTLIKDLDERNKSTIKIEKSSKDFFIGSNAIGMKGQGAENDLSSQHFVKEFKNDFLICAKTDGVRYLMFVQSNGRIVFNGRRSEYRDVPVYVPPFAYDLPIVTHDKKVAAQNKGDIEINYIFDGELIYSKKPCGNDQAKGEENGHSKNNKSRGQEQSLKKGQLQYLIFDSIIYKREIVIDRCYDERLDYVRQFESDFKFYQNFFRDSRKKFCSEIKSRDEEEIFVYLKDFYKTENIDFLLNRIVSADVLPHKNDGLIFTRMRYPYLPGRSKGILKWKPPYLNTIDFFVTRNTTFEALCSDLYEGDDFFVFDQYTVYGDNIYLFDFQFVFDQKEFLELITNFTEFDIGRIKVEGVIAEFSYEYDLKNKKLNQFYEILFDNDNETAQTQFEAATYFEAVFANGTGPKDDTTDGKNEQSLIRQYKEVERNIFNVFFKCLQARLMKSEDKYPVGGWNVMRTRKDKTFPNNFSTAENILDQILGINLNEDALIEQICPQPQKKLKQF